MDGVLVPGGGNAESVSFARGTSMRIHIEGKHTRITPQLLGWIAERLDDLNAPHQDIIDARVTLVKHRHWRPCRDEARVELRLARQTLDAAQTAETAYDALYAALKTVERRLYAYRTLHSLDQPAFDSAAGRSAVSG
jgi:ribosomal subunit interface protein